MRIKLTDNPRIVLPVMLVGLVVMTAILWTFMFSPVLWEAALERDAPAFASVPGTVTSIDTVRGQIQRRAPWFKPVVAYRYTVDGTEHYGTVIEPFPRSFRKRIEAGREASAYPPGATVTVHYDPEDPGRSVLKVQPGPDAGMQKGVTAAVGAFLALVWLILLFKTWSVFSH